MSLVFTLVIPVSLLIYPYWNVNHVECGDNPNLNWLLIYPYWNVNLYNVVIILLYKFLLIYPYWNVNFVVDKTLSLKFETFNLSILECK